MPNDCTFEMRAAGTPEAIDEFMARLLDYDHRPHFWRVFEAIKLNCVQNPDDGRAHATIYGYCAWSVHSCMNKGFGTYADEFHDKDPTATTSLRDTSHDLNLEIEVYSQEPGIGFAEHYHYNNGEVIVEEERDYCEYYYDESEYDSFEDFKYEFDEIPDTLKESDLDDGTYAIGGFEHVFFDD